MEMRFTNLEDALKRLELRIEEESEQRVTSEKKLREDVEDRIVGLEKRMEVGPHHKNTLLSYFLSLCCAQTLYACVAQRLNSGGN